MQVTLKPGDTVLIGEKGAVLLLKYSSFESKINTKTLNCSQTISRSQNNSIHNQLISSDFVKNKLKSSASRMSFQGVLNTVFVEQTVYGGIINIYINSKGDAFHSPPTKKRRTITLTPNDIVTYIFWRKCASSVTTALMT